MNIEKATFNLCKAVQPYLFFWSEWSCSGYCNLTSANITLINEYRKRNFQHLMGDENYVFSEVEKIKLTVKRLESGYPIFKSLVIVNFLMKTAALASNYEEGYEKFLLTPIMDLKISDDQKKCYMNFKTETLQQLFQFYREDFFLHENSFNQIIEFQKLPVSHTTVLST